MYPPNLPFLIYIVSVLDFSFVLLLVSMSLLGFSICSLVMRIFYFKSITLVFLRLIVKYEGGSQKSSSS